MTPSFDIKGAKSAGYSDAEIADHIAQTRGFDAPAARKAGYSTDEILGHLVGSVKPPVPTGLGGPPDRSGFLSNLARSIARFSPGPIGSPEGRTIDQLKADATAGHGMDLNPLSELGGILSGIGQTFAHPLDALYEDPIGAANTLGSPIQMLTHPRSIAAIKAGGADIAKGTAKAGIGAGIAKMGPFGEIMDAVTGVPFVTSGVKQAGRGIRNAWQAAKSVPLEPPPLRFRSGSTPSSTSMQLALPPPSPFNMPGVPDTSGPIPFTPPEQWSQPPQPKPSAPPAAQPATNPIAGPPGRPIDLSPAAPTAPPAAPTIKPVSLAPTDIAVPSKMQQVFDHATEQRTGKNLGMATYFHTAKIPIADIEAMTEAEYNKHVKLAGYRASTGKGFSRPHVEAKAAVVEALKKLREE